MSATQQTAFFWSDWLGDQAVRRLTPAERGVWIDLVALAAIGSPVGYVCDDRGRPLTLGEIARVANAGNVDEVDKLISGILEKGAASRDRTGRLFNRRMVREAERAAKKKALSDKRSVAGRSGAAQTALKYFGKQILPGHVPRHLTRHLPRETLENHSLERKITSSFSGTPREASNKSAVSLTPLADGSLARQPTAEPADNPSGPPIKAPSQVSRTELEKVFAARNAAANVSCETSLPEGIPEFLKRTA